MKIEIGFGYFYKRKISLFPVVDNICQMDRPLKPSLDSIWYSGWEYRISLVPLYISVGGEISKVADGVYAPVWHLDAPVLNVDILVWDTQREYLLISKSTAELMNAMPLHEARQHAEKFKQYGELLYLVYGSCEAGESLDKDILLIATFSPDIAKKMYEVRHVKPRISPRDSYTRDDYVVIKDDTYGAFERLALECLAHHQGLLPLLNALPAYRYPLTDAIRENTQRLRFYAQQVPCNFTLRKAVFATLQERLFNNSGVFAWNKTMALEAATPGEREIFHQALFHGEVSDKEVYKLLYPDAEYPQNTKTLMGRRSFLVIRDGVAYYGEYDSDFGWHEGKGKIEPYQGMLFDILDEPPELNDTDICPV